MGEAGKAVNRTTEGQMERGTPLKCEQCLTEFTPKNRNGIRARFCSVLCKDRFKNGQRLKGAALLKERKPAIQRRVNPGKRLVDLAVIPIAERPALLAEAARRLGLTENGPIVQAARRAAQSSAPLQPEAA